MEQDEFNYYFSIVGDIETQSDILEKIFCDLGVFDTKTVNPHNQKSFINFISFCINHQTYNELSNNDINSLLENIQSDIKVSANWSIIPPKYTNSDLAITYFRFKKENDMKKYLTHYVLGNNYHIIKE